MRARARDPTTRKTTESVLSRLVLYSRASLNASSNNNSSLLRTNPTRRQNET